MVLTHTGLALRVAACLMGMLPAPLRPQRPAWGISARHTWSSCRPAHPTPVWPPKFQTAKKETGLDPRGKGCSACRCALGACDRLGGGRRTPPLLAGGREPRTHPPADEGFAVRCVRTGSGRDEASGHSKHAAPKSQALSRSSICPTWPGRQQIAGQARQRGRHMSPATSRLSPSP